MEDKLETNLNYYPENIKMYKDCQCIKCLKQQYHRPKIDKEVD